MDNDTQRYEYSTAQQKRYYRQVSGVCLGLVAIRTDDDDDDDVDNCEYPYVSAPTVFYAAPPSIYDFIL